MTSAITFDRDEVPPAELGSPGGGPAGPDRGSPARALRFAAVPLAVSVGVNAVFLVVWWLPEYSRFPGHDTLLTQLTPLASMALTSRSEPVVAVQQGRGSLVATVLLVTAALLPFLVRSHRFALRVLAPTAICYLGAVGWVVTLLGLLARGTLAASWVGMVLLTGWVAAAAVTVWRSLRVRVDDLPGRPTRLLWLVVLYALLHPLPMAAGRALFAPELTAAARGLADGDPSVRLAALHTSASVAVYAAGVGLALVGWAVAMLVPPVRPLRVPWVRTSEPGNPLVRRLLILALCGLGLVVSASAADRLGAARAEQIAHGSPAVDLPGACAAWTLPDPARPVLTVVAQGRGCQRLVRYAGYAKVGESRLDVPLVPVRASTPAGHRITTRVVSGQFGELVVLGSSGGLDAGLEQLQGVGLRDGRVRWTFRCDDDRSMSLRFAAATGGEDLDAGRFTEIGERSTVVVSCTNQSLRLDPRTGRPLRG